MRLLFAALLGVSVHPAFASDKAKSFARVKKAAARGDAESQCKIASAAAAAGKGPEAVQWYRKAAEQGWGPAEHNLALLLIPGKLGVPENPFEAIYWERKAADQGITLAKFGLGGMYQDGLGTPKNLAQAAYWLKLAQADGFTQAAPELEEIGRQDKSALSAASAPEVLASTEAPKGNPCAEGTSDLCSNGRVSEDPRMTVACARSGKVR